MLLWWSSYSAHESATFYKQDCAYWGNQRTEMKWKKSPFSIKKATTKKRFCENDNNNNKMFLLTNRYE